MSDYRWGPGGQPQNGWNTQSGQQPVNAAPFSGAQPRVDNGYPPNTGGYVPLDETDYNAQSPFDEPEDAPELRDSRSDHLYSRSEPFWNSVTNRQQAVHRTYKRDSNYWTHQETMMDDQYLGEAPEEEKKPRWMKQLREKLHLTNPRRENAEPTRLEQYLGAHAGLKLAAIVITLLVVGYLVFSATCEIRVIRVVGNSKVDAQTIIDLSGLKPGMTTISMDLEKIAERVEKNRYLQCTLVDVNMDEVTIHVHERTPMVYLDHNGIVLVMDIQGYVLEESRSRDVAYPGLIHATGMNLRRSLLGQQVVTVDPLQLSVYSVILLELKAMQVLPMIKELDMSNMDSIYLKTHSGFDVRLGDYSLLHEKLRAMTVVHERIPQLDPLYTEGTIDVSHPEAPTYDPSEEIKNLIHLREEELKQRQNGQQ